VFNSQEVVIPAKPKVGDLSSGNPGLFNCLKNGALIKDFGNDSLEKIFLCVLCGENVFWSGLSGLGG